MTPTELHELVKSIEAPDTVSAFNNGFYTLTVEEVLALCKKVQALALRDAAETLRCDFRDFDAATLYRMAAELEGKA